MSADKTPENEKGHPATSALYLVTTTSENRTLTVWQLHCKLELTLKRTLDSVHGAEFSDIAEMEKNLIECVTDINEVIREIRGKLRQ